MELLRRRRGIEQIGEGLGTLDREVFEAIAESPSPLLDSLMPRLTRAADHSKLWFALAAVIGAVGSTSAKRGAARGVATLAVTSLVTNQVAKRVWKRPRPNYTTVPLIRRSQRMPTSNSLPSGHSASAAAFAVGVGLEVPPLGLGLALLAVGGGDGTVSCAAGIALQAGVPFAVFPGGTFNHFAKDIGCDTVAKTVAAIREGSIACVDVLRLNETDTVINTASIGAYPAFVRSREKLEHKIGKPLAGAYAIFHTLRNEAPVRIKYDNKTLQTSLFFLGNSVYLPSGFAPSRRTRMDDGLIDVRILETGKRFSTLRLMTSLALGRLVRSPLYHEMRVPEFSFQAVDGPTPLAHDGEVEMVLDEATFTVNYRGLPVFRPL